MALITRIARLFRADLHAVLDRMEEPDVLLRQAVREMEEALAADEQRLRLLRHEQEQLTARRRELARALERLAEEIDLCFASGKEELARTLIRRQLEAQRLEQVVARRAEALQGSVDGLAARTEENRGRLESMRQKAELLAEEERGERDATPADAGAPTPVRDEEVEVAFLREKQRRAQS